jgi:hypothetical protein
MSFTAPPAGFAPDERVHALDKRDNLDGDERRRIYPVFVY